MSANHAVNDTQTLFECLFPRSRGQPRVIFTLVVAISLLVRAMVAVNYSYSGSGKPPMFGDFEAQRHWLEITHNLPSSDWYRQTADNDLQYWGLDYPPLTAYHSWFMAKIAEFVEPNLVTLHTSRGYETPSSKRFMRYTVLASDLLVFISAVMTLIPALHEAVTTEKNVDHNTDRSNSVPHSASDSSTTSPPSSSSFVHSFEAALGAGSAPALSNLPRTIVALLLVLLHPAYILIDHGHFQYNCVCLGLVLWSFYFLLDHHSKANVNIGSHKSESYSHLVASICFVAALSYKQMALYFAPAIFVYLLADSWKRSRSFVRFLGRVALIGIVVVTSFAIFFAPFLTSLEAIGHVLHRMFPFARGLYEDKVANFWCATAPVFRWKERFETQTMLRLSLLCTLAGLIPSSIAVFRKPSLPRFALTLSAHAFSFFLFSFQVHEKTILLPLLPLCAILFGVNRKLNFYLSWLTSIGIFSMYPLLEKDGLALPYFAFQGFYAMFSFSLSTAPAKPVKYLAILSIVGCGAIHFCLTNFKPPQSLPDLFLLMFAAYAAAHFMLAFLGLNLLVFHVDAPSSLVAVHSSKHHSDDLASSSQSLSTSSASLFHHGAPSSSSQSRFESDRNSTLRFRS